MNARSMIFTWAAGITILFGLGSAISAAPGTEGAGFLNISPGGRPAALGGAYSALATDAYAPLWNPSGLGFLNSSQLAGTHLSYLESISYEFVSFVHPFRRGDSMGIAVQYFDPDDIPETNELGTRTGSYSGSNAAYSVAYGHAFSRTFALGTTGKFIRSEIADESAQTFGADFGGMYHPHSHWTFAATVMNIGNHLKFINQEDSLPTSLKLGVGFQPGRRWTLVLDGNLPKSETASIHSGIEWNPIPLIALRTGYRSDPSRQLTGLTGFSAGIGLRLLRQQFDYTWTTFDELGTAQYFSLLFQWNTLRKDT